MATLMRKVPAMVGPGSPVNDVARKLFEAIIGQESGGNHLAVNRDSGALGLGQVMPYNVGPWSKEALGRSITPQEFLASRDLQVRIIRHKLAQYFAEGMRETGREDLAVRWAASAWYSGKGSRYQNDKPQATNGRSYPSIASYTLQVLARYQKA